MKQERKMPMIAPSSSRPYRRRKAAGLLAGCVILAAACFLAVSLAVPLSAGQSDDMPKVLRAGFLSRVFHDIDPRDAKATLEILAREISRNMGLLSSPKVVIFPDMTAMTGALRRGELEVVSMPTLDYLKIRHSVRLTPAFVGAHNNGMGTSYVLVARRDSGFRSIADLKGKSLLILPESKHESGHIWLDVLLMKAGKANRGAFFRQIKESPKATHAITGVFFRQTDAAVVTRSGFDASRLLNPQIERDLAILSESGYLSDGVTCFPYTTSDKTKTTLVKAINKLNESTKGRQLYTIFQTSGTTPFNPSYLKGLEELLRERDRLMAKTAKRR